MSSPIAMARIYRSCCNSLQVSSRFRRFYKFYSCSRKLFSGHTTHETSCFWRFFQRPLNYNPLFLASPFSFWSQKKTSMVFFRHQCALCILPHDNGRFALRQDKVLLPHLDWREGWPPCQGSRRAEQARPATGHNGTYLLSCAWSAWIIIWNHI